MAGEKEKNISGGRIGEKPWGLPAEDALKKAEVTVDQGLSDKEVQKRQEAYGPNLLREKKKKSAWTILLNQFKNIIILLLVAAAALSFGFGRWMEGIAIAAVLILNGVIGFFTELKAVRSMEALRELSRVETKVRRGGEIVKIPADQIVPGDIVIFEGGDIVTADLRLLEASKLQADESTFTGESTPVSKETKKIGEETDLSERNNMLFKGTSVTRGSGEGLVVATGMKTELGNISELTSEAEEEITPLEKRLNKLGHRLIYVTIAIAVVVAVSGILVGKEIFLMVQTSIALAVAAIPEGLPIVATIALARGMKRMANRNALVNRLSTVETLGATNVILTDKTGTITENAMTVKIISTFDGDIKVDDENGTQFKKDGEKEDPESDDILKTMIQVGVLCNNATLPKNKDEDGDEEKKKVGDPLERALLEVGLKADVARDELIEEMPEEREEAFDPEVKMMATFNKNNGEYFVAVKGATEAVLEASTKIKTEEGSKELNGEEKKKWIKKENEMAEQGLRVLAFAFKSADNTEDEPYKGLEFLGLMGMEDPPRKNVKEAIEKCKEAGVKIVMVTGDHEATARKISRLVGIVGDDDEEVKHSCKLDDSKDGKELIKCPVFARVSPKQKLDLIKVHQDNNSVVGMTGDGVNDAPALKKADIGIAVGQNATQVAKEASDMILKDSSFFSIVEAIKEGRIIFNNIRKFVLYLLPCNVSEVIAVLIAFLLGAPLPILPLQILFINVISDVFPALALGVGKGNPAVIKKKPRDPKEPIFTKPYWISVLFHGTTMGLAVIAALLIAMHVAEFEKARAVSISFLTLAFAQMWHVFNVRDRNTSLFINDVTKNPYVWGAVTLGVILLIIAVYFSPLARVLELVRPGFTGWGLIAVMSFIPLVIAQSIKLIPLPKAVLQFAKRI